MNNNVGLHSYSPPLEAGIDLINSFAGMREPTVNPTIDRLNKFPPHKGWSEDGYNILEMDPAGKILNKVI